MQDVAGNRAVVNLLAQRRAIQRDDEQPSDGGASAGGLSLAQRNALHTLLASRTSDAFTKFGDACVEVRGQLRAERAAQVELGMLIVGTVFAFAVPGLGRSIAALANRIPAGASTTTYRAALAIQDQASSIASAIGNFGKEGAKSALKAALATNADDYTYALAQAFSVKKDDIVGYVANNIEDRKELPDEKLWLYVANWDPAEITQRWYEGLIRTEADRFTKMVEPIGTPVVRELGGPTNLGRSTEGPWGLFEHYSQNRYMRRTWVHQSVWEPAIRRSYEEHEGPWVMRFRGDEIITGGESAPMYEWQSPDELRGRYKEYATQEWPAPTYPSSPRSTDGVVDSYAAPMADAAARDLDIVVFGASGFVGRLVAEHLTARTAACASRWRDGRRSGWPPCEPSSVRWLRMGAAATRVGRLVVPSGQRWA